MRHSLLFFSLFFLLQLIFAEGGIVSLVQVYTHADRLEKNVQSLIKIKENLTYKVQLAHINKSYIYMNAHRVGLLAEDEYLIRVPEGLFSASVSYSPGAVVRNQNSFKVSSKLLFFIAFSIQCIIYSFHILCSNKEK